MKTIKSKNRKLVSNIIIVLLIIALPIFVWALVNLNFNYKRKAASGEPSVCIADENKTIVVTDAWGTDGGTCHDIQTAINAVNGDGYTILINRGDYNITESIYITDKVNLKIEGNVEGNLDEVWLSFNTTNGGGYGIKVTNSSGWIERLHAEGITPNGLLSVQNSNNFYINRTYLYGTSSHTFDIQNSNNVSIANSEVKSSAGAIEIENSQNIGVTDNKINNSTTGISAHNSTSVSIVNNLITANNGGAIRLWNVGPYTEISHNTIAYNIGSSPTIDISGVNPAPNKFSQNIVAFNTGAGLVREANSTNFDTISFNDVFSNYSGYNYAGMTDLTGTNGNISVDPLLNTQNGYYCLLSGSPAFYGAVNSHEYMGHAGPCSTSTPLPSPAGVVPLGTIGRPSVGPANAPIKIIEFIDFQCPFCKTFNDQILPQLVNAYPNKIEFIFKEFPLTIHPQAYLAAEAAECAFEQNKFVNMHDILFANQSSFASVSFSSFAQQIGLNMEQFNNCMSTKKYDSVINQDIADAQANGVNGTPTFLINGTLLQGAQPLSAFKEIIDPILPALKNGDVNNDNKVNMVDIGIVVDEYDSTNPVNKRADVNGNGKVDLIDIGIIIDNYEW